jgi:phosphonate transport system substrate-binding protein
MLAAPSTPGETSKAATRYRLSVCPHDTAKNLAGWFVLNTYLQRKLGIAMRFEPADNFNIEREQVLAGGYHLVYANPFSALQFHRQRGFVPLARPIALFDETLLIAPAGQPLPHEGELKIASATEKLIVHFLGLTLLDQLQIPLSRANYQFVGNHLKAAQAVLNGQANAAFVFNETWNGLATKTRAGLQVLAQTESRQASHCFCVGPELADRADDIRTLLCGMRDDPSGLRILEDLHFQGFEAVDVAAVERLAQLVSA